jgi:hypothetical protein
VSAPAEAAAAPAIRGFIDGLSGSRIDGWAFEPAFPTERVVVELRLAGETVATTVADRHRADLVRAGIGDAFHGFRFALQPAWAERRSELTAVARGLAGGEAALPLFQRGGTGLAATPPAPPPADRRLEQLAAGQRALEARLAELAGALATPPPVEAAADSAGEAPLADTAQRLAVLEAWVARLDDRLAALQQAAAEQPPAPATPGGLDPWQLVLLALLAVFGLGALATFALVLAL